MTDPASRAGEGTPLAGKLKILLGDTPDAQHFIAWVIPTLHDIDARPDNQFPGKMKRQSDEYRQIEAVHRHAKELHKAMDALGDPAKLRLASSGFWEQERIPQDLYDLMCAAGSALDQQSLKHGEKQTLNDADIAKTCIIEHGFRTFLKNREISASETSVFYRVVEILVKPQKSPKALIKKACRL